MAYTFEGFTESPDSLTDHYLVIGHPIGHSLSPLMHQTALNHYGIDAKYHAVQLHPKDLPAFAAWCNMESFKGCNITIPYKDQLFEFIDTLDPLAQEIGAINTIVKEDGQLKGYNTDAEGFIIPLQPYIDLLDDARAIIFGTGGASRAVYAALKSAGVSEIIYVSRNPSQITVSQSDLFTETVGYDQWEAYAPEAQLFVNTTPVGMYPNSENCFLNAVKPGAFDGKIFYDLIYNPLQTRFLEISGEAGADTIGGLEMLIHQGSAAFRLWTGEPFPEEIVKNKLLNHFNPQNETDPSGYL